MDPTVTLRTFSTHRPLYVVFWIFSRPICSSDSAKCHYRESYHHRSSTPARPPGLPVPFVPVSTADVICDRPLPGRVLREPPRVRDRHGRMLLSDIDRSWEQMYTTGIPLPLPAEAQAAPELAVDRIRGTTCVPARWSVVLGDYGRCGCWVIRARFRAGRSEQIRSQRRR